MIGTSTRRSERDHRIDTALVIGLATLSATTAAIHYQIGGLGSLMGMLFWANAVGFAGLTAALVVPLAIARRFRALVQLGMATFAGATAVGWVLFGARYDTGYLSFGIEVAIVALGLVAVYRDRHAIAETLRRVVSALKSVRGRAGTAA